MKILLAVLAVLASASPGCIGVGSRVCAEHQAGCDFTDHVLRVFPSGTVCPTWNVQFSFYQPDGQPTDTYGVQYGNDKVMETLRKASQNNLAVHVWYAGSDYVIYNKCHSDFPLVVYDAQIVEENQTI